jgi:hypothetical protein
MGMADQPELTLRGTFDGLNRPFRLTFFVKKSKSKSMTLGSLLFAGRFWDDGFNLISMFWIS